MTHWKPAYGTLATVADAVRLPADRAVAGFGAYISGHRRTYDSKTSLTTAETIYGSPLACWIQDTFGILDGKFIPDEVFTWGEEFCRGLLCGLLCGDGSITASKDMAKSRDPARDGWLWNDIKLIRNGSG